MPLTTHCPPGTLVVVDGEPNSLIHEIQKNSWKSAGRINKESGFELRDTRNGHIEVYPIHRLSLFWVQLGDVLINKEARNTMDVATRKIDMEPAQHIRVKKVSGALKGYTCSVEVFAEGSTYCENVTYHKHHIEKLELHGYSK